MTTSFQDYILNRLDLRSSEILNTLGSGNTGNTGNTQILANNKIVLLQGIESLVVPDFLALCAIVQKGSATVITNDGSVLLSTGAVLDLEFRALNYVYPSITIDLPSSQSEVFLKYELLP